VVVRSLFLAVAACMVALTSTAAAASWTPTASFPLRGSYGADSAGPRIAVAPDGTSVAASVDGRDVLVVSGDARGRCGVPAAAERWRAADPAVAAGPHGEALVAWEDATGIRVRHRARAGRPWTTRLVARSTGSSINGVFVARVPGGGFVLAERRFPAHGSGMHYHVRALRLDAGAAPVGAVQDFGPGFFGIDARQSAPLAIGPTGVATLAFESEPPSSSNAPPEVMVARAPAGRPFGPATAVADGMGRSRVWNASTGLVAATRTERCGDVGCFGAPQVLAVDGSGASRLIGGPVLAQPGRAFNASAVALGGGRSALVFELKTQESAFSVVAPVRAATVAADASAGPLQTLTSAQASEPVALPLSGGRALALWATSRAWGTALAGPDGTFGPVRAPAGPPPPPFHTNATNRDVHTAGRWAAVAWAQGKRVRLTVRGF